jgi:hypothetical protein
MCAVDGDTICPTGMMVVDHIVKMESPPQDVIIHSCNSSAAREMVRRLEESDKIMKIRFYPFPEMIRLAKRA